MHVATRTLCAITLTLSVLGVATPTSAACRCVCYQGRAEARCNVGDLTPPICSNLCLESASQTPIRNFVDRPLAGGGQALESVTPSDPNWQLGPERGAYAYGADPATGNAPLGAGGAATASGSASAPAAGLGR